MSQAAALKQVWPAPEQEPLPLNSAVLSRDGNTLLEALRSGQPHSYIAERAVLNAEGGVGFYNAVSMHKAIIGQNSAYAELNQVALSNMEQCTPDAADVRKVLGSASFLTAIREAPEIPSELAGHLPDYILRERHVGIYL